MTFEQAARCVAVGLCLVATEAPGFGQEYCPADFNQDQSLDGGDFNAWLAAFNAQDPIADVNNDMQLDGADFNAWLGLFTLGCEPFDPTLGDIFRDLQAGEVSVAFWGIGDSTQLYQPAIGGRETGAVRALIDAGMQLKYTPLIGPGDNNGSGSRRDGREFQHLLSGIQNPLGELVLSTGDVWLDNVAGIRLQGSKRWNGRMTENLGSSAHDRGLEIPIGSTLHNQGSLTVRYTMAEFPHSVPGSGYATLHVKRQANSAVFAEVEYYSKAETYGYRDVDLEVNFDPSSSGDLVAVIGSQVRNQGTYPIMTLGSRAIRGTAPFGSGFGYETLLGYSGQGPILWARVIQDQTNTVAIDRMLQQNAELADVLVLWVGMSGHGADDEQFGDAYHPDGLDRLADGLSPETGRGDLYSTLNIINRIRNRALATGTFAEQDIYVLFNGRNENFTSDANRESFMVESHAAHEEFAVFPASRPVSTHWLKNRVEFVNPRDLLPGFGSNPLYDDPSQPGTYTHMSREGHRVESEAVVNEILTNR